MIGGFLIIWLVISLIATYREWNQEKKNRRKRALSGNSGSNGRPYGMRYLKSNGDCQIHYCDEYSGGRNGRGRQKCCFFESYSEYNNEDGDTIIKKSLSDTIRAMQSHDNRCYKIKCIIVGGRRIEC